MKKSLLLLVTMVALGFSSTSQTVGDETYKAISECKCREIVMIANKIEKTYTATWLEGVQYQNGTIIFSKGETVHSWNADKITFVEKGNGFIRVYLD